MVLPPLELFSLREELPCCRAALSVSSAHFCPYPLPRSPPLPTPSTRFRTPRKASNSTGPPLQAPGLPPHTSDKPAPQIPAPLSAIPRQSPWELVWRRFPALRPADRQGQDPRQCPGPTARKENTSLAGPSIQHSIPACFSVNARSAWPLPGLRTRTTPSSTCTRAVVQNPRLSPRRPEQAQAHLDQSQAHRLHAQTLGRTFFAHCPGARGASSPRFLISSPSTCRACSVRFAASAANSSSSASYILL